MYRLAILLFAALPVAAFAQANAKVPDPDPELERKTFILPEGFEVNLFAADPLLAKPIQMNFDPQGRLWVASSEVYPQIKPGQAANDKIIVLEDADGDGKADKTTIFADGLLIPTGVEPGDSGAYVANSTELVHLSASKPGGKADKTRVVLSGFGTEDTHHIIHTFRWGPDGCLYFNQSIYIHSHIETPHGVKRLNAGGIWRFRPETMGLDVFVRGFVNSWGHHFDRWGQSLITDGAYGEGINHGVPGAYFVTAVGANRIMKGLNPGSPKHCGLEVVSGRHLPDDWQGDAITNDFRGHRVCRFKLGEDGSTFTSREQVEVIKSNHPAFRPIDVKMGPDGAIYIADWYNPIIQHGEVDFRDPRRDKTHGRIWRVTAKGRPLVSRPKLVDATIPELLEALKAPEGWTRQQAKRVLQERGRDAVVPELAKWVRGLPADDEAARLEAAWVYQGLGVHDEDLPALCRAKDARVRAAAVRIVSRYYERVTRPNVLPLLAAAAADEHPRVRLEAVRALPAVVNTLQDEAVRAAEVALGVLDRPTDRVLDYALWLTARDLEPVWMPAFKAGTLDFGGDARKLAFALDAVGTKDVVRPLLALIDSNKVPPERLHGLYLLLARTGGPTELGRVVERAAAEQDLLKGQRAELAQAVEEAVRVRKVARPPALGKFRLLLMSPEREARLPGARLVGLWKVEGLRKDLEAIGRLPADAYPPEAAAALEGIALFGDAEARAYLDAAASPDAKPEVRRLAIVALAGLDTPAAAAKAAEFLAAAAPADEVGDLFTAFFNRKGGSAALAKALDSKKLHPDVAKLGLKAVRASVQDAKPLSEALTKAGGLAAARTDYTPAEVKAYVDDVLAKGDPARGEQVYRRKDATCLACHAIAGAGGQVGPDMTSIGASAQVDYLVESILLPNKAIKEGYHALKVATLDGKVYVGVKTREADGKLYLRNAEDKEIAIPDKDIEDKAQSRSLMPDGLGDQLTRQEFVDLIRFMSELGKVGTAYAPNKARLVRRWQVIEPTRENIHLIQRARAAAAVETPDAFGWSSAYSKVSGEFPLDALPKLVVWQGSEPFGLVRAQLDVTTGGPVKLKINGAAGLTLWVGPRPVDVKDETVVDLKSGVQTLTFSVDLNKRKDGLRVELEDVPGSPARVNIVSGK